MQKIADTISEKSALHDIKDAMVQKADAKLPAEVKQLEKAIKQWRTDIIDVQWKLKKRVKVSPKAMSHRALSCSIGQYADNIAC